MAEQKKQDGKANLPNSSSDLKWHEKLWNQTKDDLTEVWRIIKTFYYSLEIDVGLGGGFGGAVEVQGAEAKLIARGDLIAIQKKSGCHPEFGQVSEVGASVSSPGVFLGKVHEDFIYYDSKKEPRCEYHDPDWDYTWGVGGSVYLFAGATVYIGIDFEYLIENLFGVEI